MDGLAQVVGHGLVAANGPSHGPDFCADQIKDGLHPDVALCQFLPVYAKLPICQSRPSRGGKEVGTAEERAGEMVPLCASFNT